MDIHSNQTLSGVSCTVQECIYNKNGKSCTANSISVHGKDPCNCCDTECATFKNSR